MKRKGGFLRLVPVLALVGIVIYVIITRYVFVVHTIEVVLPPNDRFTQESAGWYSGIQQGIRLAEVDEAQVAANLSQTGWLKLNGIEFEYPNRVVLNVGMREPAALVRYVGTLLVTDEDGVLLEQLNYAPDYPNCVYVSNMNVVHQQPGKQLQCERDQQFDVFTKLLHAVRAAGCTEIIDTVNMDDPKRLVIYSKNYVRVELGDSEDLDVKVGWMKAVVEDLMARNESFGTLDVTAPRHADYIPQT